MDTTTKTPNHDPNKTQPIVWDLKTELAKWEEFRAMHERMSGFLWKTDEDARPSGSGTR